MDTFKVQVVDSGDLKFNTVAVCGFCSAWVDENRVHQHMKAMHTMNLKRPSEPEKDDWLNGYIHIPGRFVEEKDGYSYGYQDGMIEERNYIAKRLKEARGKEDMSYFLDSLFRAAGLE